MHLARLKLQLIQQIIATDDPAVLEKIRRILDQVGPNMVAEGGSPYFKLEDRMYTADEVRAMLAEVWQKVNTNIDLDLTQEEWDELEADRAAYLRGEGKNYTWDDVKARMKERASKYQQDEISEADKAELDQRHEARLSGKSIGIPAEDSLRMIRARRK